MRRKLFFCTILYIIIALIVTEIEYNSDDIDLNNQQERECVGVIKTIEIGDKATSLVVRLSDGSRVLLKYYGQQNITQQMFASTIEFKGELEIPTQRRNPNCFDYRLYLKSIGIEYVASVEKIRIIEETKCPYNKCCKYLLLKKASFLGSIKSKETRAFVDGILFGNTSNLDDAIYDEFKTNGTAHILAVSGLHVGIIYSILEKFIGKRQSAINVIITMIFLWALCIVAGWTPSVIRATGMIMLKKYAEYKDLRYDTLTALSFIAIIMISSNPYVIYSAAFQMSYLAVLSIRFIIPHIPKKIPDFLAIIIAVNIGLIPYQIFQFNTFSVTSVFANIPIVYLAGILLPIIFGQLVVYILTGINISFLTDAVSKLLIEVNEICTFDIDTINVKSPPLWVLILVYLSLSFFISETFYILFSRKKYREICACGVIILILSVGTYNTIPNDFDAASVVFVDVGQGDCVHIKAQGKNVLIDGGGNLDFEVGKKTVMPYLLRNGVDKIDLAIATHRHTDHYKGLEELKQEKLIETIEVGIVAGKTYKVTNDVFIETLWPLSKPSDDEEQDENKNCSVFMVHYGKTKIMITGDLDEDGERKMLEYYEGTSALKADILKLGHHGSKYSSSHEFLEAVGPSICVIQVGKNNYGHPHVKTIEKCEEKCIMVLRNDIHGAIGFSFLDETIEYNTMF